MTASTTHTPTARFAPSRWLPCVAALALLAAPVPAVWAQAVPQGASVNDSLDPPGSIARLGLMEGAVSYAPGDAGSDNAWRQAQLNRPLTAGDRLWTGEQSRSELHIGSTAVRLNGQTSLDFLALDDNTTQLRLAQGTVRLRVRQLFEGQRLEIDTPNLAFVISQPGDYRVDANPASNTTRVVAQSGAGVLYGDSGAPINLGNQQQGNFTGTNLTPAAPGSAVLDSFDNWAMARDQREDQSVSARYVPRETVGYQQLDNYGDWSQDPSYGPVWLPRAVPANWAPYRAGHWSWIAPWGWTWVDDAPWGFAPFHYGRWAQIGPRWAWVPGRLQPRPVYAPALVAFVGGNGGGANWSISLGSGGPPRPAVGWFPLAPGEAFRPAYRVSPRYVTRVNNNIVVNNTVNVTNVYRYQRQPAAVTAASTSDFASGRAGRGSLQAVNASDLGRARLVNAAAEREALPQRPERRDIARAAPAALPPATVTTRPVVDSHAARRDERAQGQPGDSRKDRIDRNDRREDGRDGRDARNVRVDRPQPTPQASAAPQPAIVTAPAAPAPQTQQREREGRQERDGRDRDARREQAARPVAAPLVQAGPLPGPLPVPAAAAPPAERGAEEQARRTAQRSQEQQAQAQQQQQQRAQRDQGHQQRLQQQQQQESARRQAGEQAQAERKAQAEQRAQQAQERNQERNQDRNQQRQAHEQAQRQQQEQRQQRAQASEERQQSRKAEAAAIREAREGQAQPNRQQ
ncbi:MAG: DUF6600 domain-containing protein [Pseudomonadota bacterium]